MKYTKFTGLKAELIMGHLAATAISSAVDVALTEDQKTPYIGVTLTAASKSVTLGLPDGVCCIVVNEGSNAFTLKNVSGDSGTSAVSVTAGKAYLVRASTTANGSKLTLLNDGT